MQCNMTHNHCFALTNCHLRANPVEVLFQQQTGGRGLFLYQDQWVDLGTYSPHEPSVKRSLYMNVMQTVHVTVEMHFKLAQRKLGLYFSLFLSFLPSHTVAHTQRRTHKQLVTTVTSTTRPFLCLCVILRTESDLFLMEFKDFFHTFISLKLPHDGVKLRSHLCSHCCWNVSRGKIREVIVVYTGINAFIFSVV